MSPMLLTGQMARLRGHPRGQSPPCSTNCIKNYLLPSPFWKSPDLTERGTHSFVHCMWTNSEEAWVRTAETIAQTLKAWLAHPWTVAWLSRSALSSEALSALCKGSSHFLMHDKHVVATFPHSGQRKSWLELLAWNHNFLIHRKSFNFHAVLHFLWNRVFVY